MQRLQGRTHGLFKEVQGGQCGWNKENEEAAEGGNVREVSGQNQQAEINTLAFSLSKMGNHWRGLRGGQDLT